MNKNIKHLENGDFEVDKSSREKIQQGFEKLIEGYKKSAKAFSRARIWEVELAEPPKRKYNRKFKDEFKVPLELVERNWLRRSAVILLLPFTILIFVGLHLFLAFKEIYFEWIKNFWNNKIEKCPYCGKKFNRNDEITNYNGKYYHLECAEKEFNGYPYEEQGAPFDEQLN